jgi:hypothetical protein
LSNNNILSCLIVPELGFIALGKDILSEYVLLSKAPDSDFRKNHP